MASKSQLKAVAKYDKANTVQVNLKLNKKTDKDIIEILSKVTNKQGFIKDLIRFSSDNLKRDLITIENWNSETDNLKRDLITNENCNGEKND